MKGMALSYCNRALNLCWDSQVMQGADEARHPQSHPVPVLGCQQTDRRLYSAASFAARWGCVLALTRRREGLSSRASGKLPQWDSEPLPSSHPLSCCRGRARGSRGPGGEQALGNVAQVRMQNRVGWVPGTSDASGPLCQTPTPPSR